MACRDRYPEFRGVPALPSGLDAREIPLNLRGDKAMVATTEEDAAPAPARRGFIERVRARPARPMLFGFGLCVPFFVLMAILVAYPVVKLVLVLFQPPGFVENIRSFFSQELNVVALRVTLVDSLIVTFLVVVLGSVIAWSIVTTRRPAVRLILMASVAAPLFMNQIIKVFAFTVLLQRYGFVNEVLIRLHIISSPLSLIYNQFAVIVGMTYYMMPWAVLPLYVTFVSLDFDLPLVAASLGATRTRALRDICLPLALPGIFATIVLDYVFCLGFFVMPLFLGGTSSPFTSNVIYQDITSFYNFTGADTSSVVLLVAAIVIVTAGYVAVGRERMTRALA